MFKRVAMFGAKVGMQKRLLGIIHKAIENAGNGTLRL
jgi:hypothetical protein